MDTKEISLYVFQDDVREAVKENYWSFHSKKEPDHKGAVHELVDSYLPTDYPCLLYTSPSPRDRTRSRMPSSA